MYQSIQLSRMQSSSVRIVHWKRELLHFPFHKEVSQSRQGQDQVFRVHVRFSVALVTKNHKYFPGICDAAGCKAATPPIRGLCFPRNSMFLYSLSQSAANAVLKLMTAVIAIAHVRFVSMKLRSVNFMLLEYSFGKLKYDSTTLPMSGFLGPRLFLLLDHQSLLLFLIFFLINFQCGKVLPPLPGQNIHRRPCRSHTGYQIEVGSRNE